MSNSALLSYFVVAKPYRSLQLGKFLAQAAFAKCQRISRKYTTAEFRSTMIMKHLQTNVSKTSPAAQFCVQLLSLLLPFIFNQTSQYREYFTFFAETNALHLFDGVLDSATRHKILHSIGFQLLDFDVCILKINV